MDPVLVIFNTHAGRGRAHRFQMRIEAALQTAGVAYDLTTSQSRGHAIDLARQGRLSGREVVIAAGGDGTVNEVVNGLAQASGGGAVGILGILPIGSGNDFAENMGIPLDLYQAALRVKRGHTRRVDLGIVNGRYFDNNVGIGFEALVNIESHKMTRFKGMATYLAAVFKSLVEYPFPVVSIEKDDGGLRDKRMLMVSVGNNRRIGGGFLITPDAIPDDGLLDVCIVDAIPRLEILRLLPKAMKGNHRGEPAVTLTRTRRLVIESEGPLPVHADGEILWDDVRRLQITIEPQRLEVIV